jgi:hypothetical protein
VIAVWCCCRVPLLDSRLGWLGGTAQSRWFVDTLPVERSTLLVTHQVSRQANVHSGLLRSGGLGWWLGSLVGQHKGTHARTHARVSKQATKRHVSVESVLSNARGQIWWFQITATFFRAKGAKSERDRFFGGLLWRKLRGKFTVNNRFFVRGKALDWAR